MAMFHGIYCGWPVYYGDGKLVNGTKGLCCGVTSSHHAGTHRHRDRARQSAEWRRCGPYPYLEPHAETANIWALTWANVVERRS